SADGVKKQVGKRIRVLLADDHTIVRQGLRGLLQSELDLEVVGEAENGRQAIDLAQQCSPDIVIMDVDMPVMNGIEATRLLTKEMPQVKVIALSMHVEKDAFSKILDAGATAYLTKGSPMEELVEAIRACHARPPKADNI
ncbi:MAG: TRAP-type C4-dicarboxylate transporter, periplasmic solute-binding protein, partial [Acidobacteria bacterium]|nr:TRAP-type C4-dicarboxylate transporter, periplasmic solute-binding protein [Acidobacteriota bacterium]